MLEDTVFLLTDGPFSLVILLSTLISTYILCFPLLSLFLLPAINDSPNRFGQSFDKNSQTNDIESTRDENMNVKNVQMANEANINPSPINATPQKDKSAEKQMDPFLLRQEKKEKQAKQDQLDADISEDKSHFINDMGANDFNGFQSNIRIIPVVVLTHSRADYLQKTLMSIKRSVKGKIRIKMTPNEMWGGILALFFL